MKEIKNIYGMSKKSWKRFCDSKNAIKQRRENQCRGLYRAYTANRRRNDHHQRNRCFLENG